MVLRVLRQTGWGRVDDALDQTRLPKISSRGGSDTTSINDFAAVGSESCNQMPKRTTQTPPAVRAQRWQRRAMRTAAVEFEAADRLEGFCTGGCDAPVARRIATVDEPEQKRTAKKSDDTSLRP